MHIHTFNKPLTKTIHHAVHIMSTEVELFAIRYGINQSLSLNNVSKIIVITDAIHAVKKIFDPLVHPYQLQLAAILSDLCQFFTSHSVTIDASWRQHGQE